MTIFISWSLFKFLYIWRDTAQYAQTFIASLLLVAGRELQHWWAILLSAPSLICLNLEIVQTVLAVSDRTNPTSQDCQNVCILCTDDLPLKVFTNTVSHSTATWPCMQTTTTRETFSVCHHSTTLHEMSDAKNRCKLPLVLHLRTTSIHFFVKTLRTKLSVESNTDMRKECRGFHIDTEP